MCVSVLLAFVAIPLWVSSPSNVNNIVLSPTFWPYILCALLAFVGLGLVISSQRNKADKLTPGSAGADRWLRLAGLAVIMALTMIGLDTVGMVWTSMLTLLCSALLFKTRYPVVALVCAVLMPLLLYAFFAHVAGVAIPQGQFVRLP